MIETHNATWTSKTRARFAHSPMRSNGPATIATATATTAAMAAIGCGDGGGGDEGDRFRGACASLIVYRPQHLSPK